VPRTGRFGRQPRTAPSLTNTLIAIAREYQNQRSQNIMDAWQKGGMFEGKKATDSVVLKFWRDKVDGVSPDDPLHDTYKNTVLQLDYTIHESKMTADYALKKKSDAEMVSFYLNWAKKVPKDSEFYRVLQRDAGQYMRNQKAVSQTSIKQAAELAYQRQQDGTRKAREAAGEYIIDTLRRVAQSGYADGGIAATIAAPGSGSDLTDFDPSDPETMLRLLEVITPRNSRTPGYGAGAHANDDVIFHDDDKRGITGNAIMAKLAKLDRSLRPGEPLDVTYITGLLDRQNKGLQERIDRAIKTGHMSDASELQKSKAYVATLTRQVAAWPVERAYRDLRDTFDAVANDPTASPQAVLKAHQSYMSGLSGLASDPRIAADDNMRARITAEAQGQTGIPTLNESFTGLQNGAFDPQSAKDSANTAAHMKFLQEQVDVVNSGGAAWTYGTTGKDGVFVPDPTGREIGAAPADQIAAYGAPGSMQAITVPDDRGGNPMVMYITATPVFGTATNPATGEAIHPENANPVAYAYDIPQGGKKITVYGFQSKEGLIFSSDPPWDDRLKVTASNSGGNHLEVDMTPILPVLPGDNPGSPKLGIDLTKQGDTGILGFHVQNVGNPTANNPNPTGALTFDPYTALTSTSTRNALGSTDPATDFHSITLATLMSTQQGMTILRDLDRQPAYKAQLDADSYTYAGYRRDANGAWLPGMNADPSKFGAAQGTVDMAKTAKSTMDFVDRAMKVWQRLRTGTPFAGGTQSTVPGPNGGRVAGESVSRLPTDLVAGTKFEALGKAFLPGTSSIKPPENLARPDFVINMGKAIMTPSLPPPQAITVKGPTAGATTNQPVPTQTGSQAPSQTGSQAPEQPKPYSNYGYKAT
jgi:hypothetical protein